MIFIIFLLLVEITISKFLFNVSMVLCYRWLKKNGMKQNKISQLVLNHSLSNPLLGHLAYGELQEIDLEVHSDEKTWLYLECSRSDADRILADRPDGTFLIRTSRTGQYALSIMYACCLSFFLSLSLFLLFPIYDFLYIEK